MALSGRTVDSTAGSHSPVRYSPSVKELINENSLDLPVELPTQVAERR
jgi:hypothetical protein